MSLAAPTYDVGNAAGVTPYHAGYFAHELTRRRPPSGIDRLSMSLFDARVDLNGNDHLKWPHLGPV